MASNVYTGTATVAVASGVATITKVTGDGFALLAAGSEIEINGVAKRFVKTNGGTVITVNAATGEASSSGAVAWTGQPPSDSATYSTTALDILQNQKTLSTMVSGRWNKTTAVDTLYAVDALLDAYCLTWATLTAPPSSPAAGDCHLTGTSCTGAWAGYDLKIAQYINSAWRFYTPFKGLRAYNSVAGKFYFYNDSAWTDENTTISAIGGKAVSLGGAFTLLGAYGFTGTLTNTTAITFPTSGT